MNIAIVSDYAYPYTKGGAETRYYTLAQYLINHGHQVHGLHPSNGKINQRLD